MKPNNTKRELKRFKADGTYSYHWALKVVYSGTKRQM
jgi:hypothetical protein